MLYRPYQSIHFVGIGGSGMSGIARVLRSMGYRVRGSDIKETDTTRSLRQMGIEVLIGHRADNLGDAQVVVVSSAIRGDNPELREAHRRGIPVIARAEMLAELGRLKHGVLVAGSHGKTTTTSLIATVLAHAGLDPTVIIGGRLNDLGSNAQLGMGEFLVAEADESDGSFLALNPTIAVCTNIDREHLEYFKTLQALKDAFLSFMNKVPFYGVNVLCLEDEALRGMLPALKRRALPYGFSEEASLRAAKVKPLRGALATEFEVRHKARRLFSLRLPLAGPHNVLNALAAVGVALELSIPSKVVKEALEGFSGIHRRLELRAVAGGIRVYDDYGHHPTEIRATLRALRTAFPEARRLLVVFQPHRFSRTQALFEDFTRCFPEADVLLLMDIYPAGEPPVKGVSSQALQQAVKTTQALYVRDHRGALQWLRKHLRPDDMVLTLGAGDVWKVAEALAEKLR
jgi:UDP-N-acetylmuramate--alanine ligase